MIRLGTNKWKDDKTKCPCDPYTSSVCVLSFLNMNINIWVTGHQILQKFTHQGPWVTTLLYSKVEVLFCLRSEVKPKNLDLRSERADLRLESAELRLGGHD